MAPPMPKRLLPGDDARAPLFVQGEEHELFVEEEGVWVHDGSLLVGG